MVYTVLIADDHDLFATGIEALLIREKRFKVVGKVSDGEAAVAFVEQQAVDLVLMDLYMPKMDGFVCCRALKKLQPAIKVIAVTMVNSSDILERCSVVKMDGFVLKSDSGRDLVNCMNGVLVDSPDTLDRKETKDHPEEKQVSLTKRELEIVRLICQGQLNVDIAQTIHRSIDTVKQHRKNIYRKLGVSSKEELVQYALNHRLI